ncbi:hypothetical protein [Streptomyces avermitilis]|uniref:hypothetical protein n=1 Tax=Streptomyces avermitilis TaxID=33903 RepID=UPI002118085E|nr:hypothetical protein [Streptomyces avermitilis]
MFQADGWSFQPGRYEASLQLSRSGNHSPLIKNFCLLISKKAVDEIRGGASREDIFFWRNDMPKAMASNEYSGCYVREAEWRGQAG